MEKKTLSGFTLIELLLGLVLFSIIGVIVYGTFASGIKLSRNFDQENEVYRDVRMTFELISKELENAVPYDFSGSYPEIMALKGEENRIAFLSGGEKELKFVQYSLSQPTAGRIYQTLVGSVYSRNVSVSLVSQLNRRINYLIREEQEFFDYLKQDPSLRKPFEIISTHILEKSLKFTYGYYEDEKAQEITWQSDWNLHYLPKVIRVEMDYLIESEESSSAKQRLQHFSQDIFLPGAEGVKKENPKS